MLCNHEAKSSKNRDSASALCFFLLFFDILINTPF